MYIYFFKVLTSRIDLRMLVITEW